MNRDLKLKIKETQYPQNLLMAIFNTEYFEQCIETNNVNDFVRGLEHSLFRLTDKQYQIISLIYKHGYSYKKISEEMHISEQNERTTEKDSLENLRKKSNINYIKYGFNLCNLISKIETNKNPENIRISDIGLSPYARFRIERSGIYLLKDIKSKKRLLRIEGIGEKTATKIIEIANEYGIKIE